VPGTPFVWPFYNDPTYGVVFVQNATNNAQTVQLYKVSPNAGKPTGYLVELVGQPLSLDADITVVTGWHPAVALDNHIVIHVSGARADVAGKPLDFSAHTLAVLTRTGETIAINYKNQCKTLATDDFFEASDSQYMVRVGTDAFGRGYGLSAGDGSVFSTGRLDSIVDGISVASDGKPTIVSTTNIQAGTNFVTSAGNEGNFAVLQGWDPTTSRFVGVENINNSNINGYAFKWDLFSGAPGSLNNADPNTSVSVDPSPWTGLAVQSNGKNIEGTGYGISQTTGSIAIPGIVAYAYNAGVDDVPIINNAGGAVNAQFPLSTSAIGSWTAGAQNGVVGPYFATPSFGNHLMIAELRFASNTQFTLWYTLTNQSGTTCSLASDQPTNINTANYGWSKADICSAGRHTTGICVVGIRAFHPDATPLGFYLEAFPTT
jgi:hypothetical protein